MVISKFHKKILIVLILVQLVGMICLAQTKKSYYVDDLWSLEISQGSFDFISDKYIEKWNTPDVHKDKLTVSGEERFNFKKVIEATKKDNVHPPLYYLIINFFSSLLFFLSPAVVAIGFNMVVNILITILLYLVFRRLYFKNDLNEKYDLVYFLPSAIWIVSYASNEILMLFRMYLLLALMALALVYICLRILNKNCNTDYFEPKEYLTQTEGEKSVVDIDFSIKNATALFIVLILGLLTHYYFAVFALMILGIVSISLLLRKKYFDILKGIGIYLVSLGVAVLIFNSYFTTLLSSFHTEQGVGLVERIDFYIAISRIPDIIKNLVINFFTFLNMPVVIYEVIIGTLLVFLILCAFLLFINSKEKSLSSYFDIFNDNIKYMFYFPRLIMLFPALLFFILISVTTQYQNTRYLSIIFPFVVLIFSIGIYKLIHHIKNIRLAYVIPSIIVLFLLCNTAFFLGPKYNNDLGSLKNYTKYPVVVLNDEISNTKDPERFNSSMESLLNILDNFPAEIHTKVQYYGTNILGLTKKAVTEKYKLFFNEGNEKYLKQQNLFKNYERDVKSDMPNGILLFVDRYVRNPRRSLIKMTQDQLGFKKAKYLKRYESPLDYILSEDYETGNSFMFDVYLIYN